MEECSTEIRGLRVRVWGMELRKKRIRRRV